MLLCDFANRCLISALAPVFLVCSAFAQGQPGPASREESHNLAGRIVKKADKAKCHPDSCTVLVANFTTPSGSTSRLGIQLADSVAAEFVALGGGIKVVDRSRLQDYLVREHIPSNALKDRQAARWLATEFEANAVLLGKIERLGDQFNLLTELLNVSNDKVGPQEAMWIAIPDSQGSLWPFEPYDAEGRGPATTSAQGSKPGRAGVNGVGVPQCIYCPPPLYTNGARKAKFSGGVVLEVTIEENGRADDIRVLRGVPFGMNEQAIKSVSQWKFKPASNGQAPVAVVTPIEITFRLF